MSTVLHFYLLVLQTRNHNLYYQSIAPLGVLVVPDILGVKKLF